MKKIFTSMFALVMLALVAITLVGCNTNDSENYTVRVGIHANEGGATLFAVAQEKGFFEEEGINAVVTIVESGPAEMTAMRADNRSLDIGYIGAGVSWNAIDDSGNRLQFIYLDTLSNSEMLIANATRKPGINTNSTWQELYAALQGATIGIPTDTTPGAWFKNFVEKVNLLGGPNNTELADADKLWLHSETDAYLAGYTAPNSNILNRITVVTESNEYLPTVFSGYDFVAGFAPATTSIINNGGVQVATTASHLPEKSFPSTWVASVKWMEENPTVVQKFINALVKATDYRAKNIEESLRLAEDLCQANPFTYKADAMIAPSAEQLFDWFSSYDGLGFQYFNGMYQDKKANVPAGNRVKSLPEALNISYMMKALAEFNNQ